MRQPRRKIEPRAHAIDPPPRPVHAAFYGTAEQLDPEIFWQVHRVTVVNVRQIAAAHHGTHGLVTLNLRARPEKLAVSRSYAHLFKQM